MQIPDFFKKAIKDTFYDKKMEIWTCGKLTDDEGAVIGNGKDEKVEELKGNFQYATREYIQKEYGKEIEANIIVTCETTQAEIGNIVFYNSKDYHIKAKISSDSHITLLAYGDESNA